MPVLNFNSAASATQASHEFFELLQNLRNNRKPILVFVGCDVDAICAYHLFQYICQVMCCKELVSAYPSIGVFENNQLLKVYDGADDASEPKLVIFLNCGGTKSMLEHFNEETNFNFVEETTCVCKCYKRCVTT